MTLLNSTSVDERRHMLVDTPPHQAALYHSSQEDGGGHMGKDTLGARAAADKLDADPPNLGTQTRNFGVQTLSDLAHASSDLHKKNGDSRFTDPLVMEIVQLHRLRRRWMKAKNALVLQGKALCRSFLAGDKEEANKAFARIVSGKGVDKDDILLMALSPFLPAIEKFETESALIERQMVKLAKRLPIAAWAIGVRGLGLPSVAAIVGEAGDLSQYPTVSGVWKRLGLAVIDGERQRKCADAEKALAHGYSPERRAVVWVMADAMAKHQRTWVNKETGEVAKEPGPYGVILETEKAKALAKGWPPIRAERHAKRLMSKAVLRDLTLAWRGA